MGDSEGSRCSGSVSRGPGEVTESEWQKQVLKSAHTLGWQSMHIGRTGKHQAVGAKGTMGTGWPDLVLVKGGRIIFAELKSATGGINAEQRTVLMALQNVGEVHIWRPQDFGQVLDTLAV
jgi:hypothetical protein